MKIWPYQYSTCWFNLWFISFLYILVLCYPITCYTGPYQLVSSIGHTTPLWEGRIWCAVLHTSCSTWRRHQMETFSALLAICAGNSPVPGEFPTQRPVMRSFDVYFDLRPDKRLSKPSWGWWFETLSHSLWRRRNETVQNRFRPCCA